jgi:hypothetical protein
MTTGAERSPGLGKTELLQRSRARSAGNSRVSVWCRSLAYDSIVRFADEGLSMGTTPDRSFAALGMAAALGGGKPHVNPRKPERFERR